MGKIPHNHGFHQVDRRLLTMFSELAPDARAVEVLKGKVSEPQWTLSHKPGNTCGQRVEVFVVEEGAGLNGLSDMKDNKEWYTINNHTLLTTRGAAYLSLRMNPQGDVQRVLDGMIVSHAGRRQWDEAGWYPDIVDNPEQKRAISNETLGMQIIQGKVSQEAFALVVALGHGVEGFSVDPSIYNSLDFRLAIYVDHRTSQIYESLYKRMGDFLLGNFYTRDQINDELKNKVYITMQEIIEKRKAHHLGESDTDMSVDLADSLVAELGASTGSTRLPREELMRLVLNDADTEADLIEAGVDPDELYDIPMPKWEDDYRMDYVRYAGEEIERRIDEIKSSGVDSSLDQEFPSEGWGAYARRVYLERKSQAV